MHPFLKNIVRSPKKALERHQNHCVAVIASNFLSLQVQNCYPFYFNTTAKSAETGRLAHFFIYFASLLLKNVLQVKCSTETDW